MTYVEAQEYLHSLENRGMKLGLSRIERLLALCGNPQRRLRFVHVAGTNGKGSTARMIQSILTAAGYRTGLYASPAVTGIRDTITVDGVSITPEDFAQLTGKLQQMEGDMEDAGAFSDFEFTTALAFLHFAACHTDICVVECGLGGRDDATNIIPPPLVAVLTPISLDHTGILGKTVAEIAAVKCGIIKSPCVVVTSPAQDPEGLAVIMETAAKQGLAVRIPAEGAAPFRTLSLGTTAFDYDDISITLPLTGEFQRANALTAIEAVRALEADGLPLYSESIQQGLKNAVMPCRQEVIRTKPLVMLDGAHNLNGVKALTDTLDRCNISELTLVVGMLADKDIAHCMELLAPFCRRIVCCTPKNPRALPAHKLAELLRSISAAVVVEVEDKPAAALERAIALDPCASLLVAGSFYMAADVRPLIIQKFPEK